MMFLEHFYRLPVVGRRASLEDSCIVSPGLGFAVPTGDAGGGGDW